MGAFSPKREITWGKSDFESLFGRMNPEGFRFSSAKHKKGLMLHDEECPQQLSIGWRVPLPYWLTCSVPENITTVTLSGWSRSPAYI
jgi:hypothetical protein